MLQQLCDLQALRICLTGAWDATAQKNQDGRVFVASHMLPCVHSFSNCGWSSPKSWALECPFANQFFRQAGNAQKCRGPLHLWTFISGLVECMLEAWQEAQPWGDRGEGDMLLQDSLTPGSESHHLGRSAPSWFGRVRHFCATWGMGEEGCVNHPEITWMVDSVLPDVPDVHHFQLHSHRLLCVPGIVS